jgi:hypothetical protein
MPRIFRVSKYIAALMVLMLVAPDALAWIDPCATIATIASQGYWQNSNGDQMSLAQSASGAQITGQYIVGPNGDGASPNPVCPAGTVYTITGSYQGGGGNTFQLTGTLNGAHTNCAQTWSTVAGQSSINGQAACASLVMTWNNSAGYSKTNEVFSHPVYVPGPGPVSATSGETTAFGGWYPSSLDPNTAASIFAAYEMTFTPTYDWGGRQLTESFPSSGISDTCYTPSSKIPKLTSYPSTTISIVGMDWEDLVGVSTPVVNNYREMGVTPCFYALQQVMSVDSSTTTTVSYNSNQHINGIGNTTVYEYRAGVYSGTEPWGVPSIKLLIVPVIINPLLLDPQR